MISSIDSKTLKSLAKNEIFLVDVREQDEFDSGHIDNASLMQSTNFRADQVISILPHTKKLVFYCRSGKRSMDVCRKLEEMNDDGLTFYNLEGGILAYNESI